MKKRITASGLFLIISMFILAILYKYTNEVNLEDLSSKQIIPWSIKKINAPAVWTKTSGKYVKVAVMDSGIYYKHPDFGCNIKTGYNAIYPGQLPIDDNGHGTLVCGVIAAQNNDIGVIGVAPNVELYPVKVLDKYGQGDISAIADGIEWCIINKIQIINMSFSIDKDDPLLRDIVKKAVDAGIVVVASGSNTYGGDVGYPASYNYVISVTAVDKDLKIGDTSPKGKIDFSAPGVSVVSTSIDGNYEEFSGTSLAAPYVTGIIALVLQNPKYFGMSTDITFSYVDIYNVLTRLSYDLGEKGKDEIYGEGFIKLCEIMPQ